MRKIVSFLLFLILSGIVIPIYGKETNIVKILTWWGYFDAKWIKENVWSQCKTNLAVQSYKDTFEFNKSFELKNYDLVLYESSQLQKVQGELQYNNDIKKLQSVIYPKQIQKVFDSYVADKNNYTSLFFLADIIFLYNPKKIELAKNDTFQSIISKLQTNLKSYFVILDDPVILNRIIENETNQVMNVKSFQDAFNYKNLVISNHFIDYSNLGVLMTWSGVGINHKNLAKKEGIDLKIITIPKYAYVTADFISKLNSSSKTNCVYNLLSSKEFLTRLQNETYYYSPFMQHDEVTDVTHKKLYKEFEKNLKNNQLKWLLPSKKQLDTAYIAWEDVMLNYGL